MTYHNHINILLILSHLYQHDLMIRYHEISQLSHVIEILRREESKEKFCSIQATVTI